MPEKPEVAIVVQQLHRLLAGQRVQVQMPKWPENAPNIFQVASILDWGKYILWNIFDEQNSYSLFVQHLRMSGKWLSQADPELTIIGQLVSLNTGIRLFYYDTRKFGTWEYHRQNNLGIEQLSLKLGYDWLMVAKCLESQQGITFQFYQEFTAIKKSGKNICAWLMEQKPFAGIGNYLKAEILFIECISPETTCNQLLDWQVQQLFATICQTILSSYYSKGVSVRDYLDLNGQAGAFPRFVYKQELDQVFGQKVEQSKNAGRTTHWCPLIQKRLGSEIDLQVYQTLQAANRQRYLSVKPLLI